MTYLHPSERASYQGAAACLGFYRPPPAPEAHSFSIFGKRMAHTTSSEAAPSSRFFFFVIAKGEVYIEMSRIHNHFPTVEKLEV